MTMIKGYLIHLSFNMWCDHDSAELARAAAGYAGGALNYKPYLRFDPKTWDQLLKEMVEAGINLVLIDLGDGVRYESHPEIAVHKAWSVQRLKRELQKMRAMGIEPIPKLNFSATHDAWLGPYSRCVSSDTYYAVCRDLIAEVIDIFGEPRFFHLGMDEETFSHQKYSNYIVIRQDDLWWHDLYFYVKQVEKAGVRAWVWSDYIWHHRDEFLKKMPRSVLQSNWYYNSRFSRLVPYVKSFHDLDAHGYDQVPTGSNYFTKRNMIGLVKYCQKRVAPNRLLGFAQTVWKPTLPAYKKDHLQGIQVAAEAFRRV